METESKLILAISLLVAVIGCSAIWASHLDKVVAFENGYEQVSLLGNDVRAWVKAE